MSGSRRAYGTGTIEVRTGSGGRETYYARLYVGGRQVRRKLGAKRTTTDPGGLTRAQAERVLQEIVRREVRVVALTDRIDLAEAGRRYVDHLEQVMHRKPSTIQDYRIILNRHLVPFFGGRTLDRIEVQLVSDYLVAKQREGLAPKTVANQLTFFHGVFRHAMKRGWATSNPVAAVDRPRVNGTDPDIRFLVLEDVEALIRAVPDDYLGALDRALYLVATMTGLRQGELVALRWRDVDWVTGLIRVRRNYSRQNWGTPKSRRSSRAVPMTKRVATEFDRLSTTSRFTADDDLVFAHPETGNVYDASRLRKRFRVALNRAGVRPVRFHDLRHTFGTLAAASGVPLRTLQEWLGHRDYKTTLIYADYAPRAHEVDMIERAFAPPPLNVGPGAQMTLTVDPRSRDQLR